MRHWRVAWRRFVRPVAMAASAAAFVATLTLVPPASARSDRITAVATGSLWGYVWANQPATASYTPDPAFQKNSTGGTNTVHRTGRGRYEVRFPRLGAAQGTVDVTAYGSTDRYCKAASWSSVPFSAGLTLSQSLSRRTLSGSDAHISICARSWSG